ncbi:MAG: ATP-binding protein [archaeon]|nr:ATP-binding protein [archaeon]
MLVDFSVENYGPFRDKATLSMQATSRKEHPGNIVDCPTMNCKVLTSALVFGPNASGKSYIFKAFNDLKFMVTDAYTEDVEFPYRPYKLDQDSMKSPVSFDIRLLEDDILYEYSISFLGDRIVHEKLQHYPMKRAKLVFERHECIDDFKGKSRKLLGLLTKTTSYLVLGAKYNEEVCIKVRRMIMNLVTLESQQIGDIVPASIDYFEKDPEKRSILIKGLQKSDFAITDYRVDQFPIDKESARKFLPLEEYEALINSSHTSMKGIKVSIEHDYGIQPESSAKVRFDLGSEESIGTQYMFGLMGPIVDSLSTGKTLIIDEFGAHLHPLLTRWIVEQFSKDNNPNNSQLVAITHDIGLIDTKELVRRDQLYFTNKDKFDGSSSLYCLSDFKGIRKDDLVLKAYLSGRYDAIPLTVSGSVLDG